MTQRPPLTPLFALLAIRGIAAFQLQAAAVAAPSLIRELDLSFAQIGLAMGAFMLPGIFLTVPAGLLAGRIGDRPVLRGAFMLLAAGIALSALAESFAVLLAGRLLAGMGGVTILMLVIKMTADRFAGPLLSTATSTVIVSWPLGTALALVLLGPVEAAYGWRAVLGLSALPILAGLALTFAVGRAAPPPPSTGAPPARVGFGFIVGSALSWGTYNGAIVVMATFLPGFLATAGWDAAGAAARSSLVTWSFAVVVPFCGWAADRLIGRTGAVVLGMVLTAACFLAIAPTGGAAWVLILLGIGLALPPGALTAQVGDATPPAARPLVFGWYAAGSYCGMSSAPWIAGSLRDVTGDANAPMLWGAALMLVLAPLYAWFRWSARR
jgi:DHA1 family inner membrane transport protein